MPKTRRRRRTAIVVFSVVPLLALAAAGPSSAGVVKRLDFETGNLRQWTVVQALAGDATVIRSPRHEGRYAGRFRVRPGADPIGASGERAEVSWMSGERRGSTSWWKWSTMFPRGFRVGHHWWNVFTQWHNSGSTCQPNAQFVVDAYKRPAHLRLIVTGGRLNARTCKASSRRVFNLGLLRRGVWQTFVFHVRWSPVRSAGYVSVWRNGRLRVRKTPVRTLYFGQSVYVKQGFYRAPASWTAVVYQDGLRKLSSRPRLR